MNRHGIALFFSTCLVLCANVCQAQKKGHTDARGSCGIFMEAVADREFSWAYGLYLEGKLSDCSDHAQQLALAQTLLAMGYTAEARTLVEELALHDKICTPCGHALSRIVSVEQANRSTHTAEVLLWQDAPRKGDNLLALIAGEVPVALNRSEESYRYFPARSQRRSGYSISYHNLQPDEAGGLQSWKGVEMGPSTMLADGNLVVSLMLRKAYSRKAPLPKLYMAAPDMQQSDIQLLPFCDDEFSYMHPDYHAATRTLTFASDRPGGEGGMDLWSVSFHDGNWSEPVALGTPVNSAWDELFPHSRTDTLFFASNRPDKGYGGVDLYWYTGHMTAPQPLPSPINTPDDDFGMMISQKGKVYLISNRLGQYNRDNIYAFAWEKRRNFFKSLKGNVSGWEAYAGTEVFLIGARGDTLQSTAIDSLGSFTFRTVRGQRMYTVGMAGPKPDPLPRELRLYDHSGTLVKKASSSHGDNFIFELLTPEDYYLERISITDQSILDVEVLGRYLTSENTPIAGIQIVLEDVKGNEIGRTLTDERGDFRFETVRPEMSYVVKADDVEMNNTIHVVDYEGNVLQSIQPSEHGQFVYVRVPLGTKMITLTNELKERVSVPEGRFMDLPHVYYKFNSAELELTSETALNKLVELLNQNESIRIEVAGHTDARGSAEYNLRLSQNRVDAVKAYIASRGIDGWRITGEGFGESRLLNRCSDGVECAEEEHAINRRTEFRIFSLDP